MKNQDFGTVQFKGAELTITQLPYIDGTVYAAVAVDAEENEYRVTWPVINADCEDESDACDWEDYKVIKL